MDLTRTADRYVFAALALLLATLLRWALDPFLGDHVPVASYVAAVAIVGLYAGRGPAVLTLVAGGLLADLLFTAPRGELMDLDLEQASGLILYFLSAGVVVLLTNQLRASRMGLQASQRESERRGELLRRITDAVPMLFSFVDRELRYQYLSAGYEAWYGQSVATLRGRTVRELVGEDAFRRIEPKLHCALAGETVELEHELALPSGQSRYVRARFFPVVGEGAVAGVSVVVLDETERRHLAGRDAQLAAIVMAAQEAMITKDLDNRITSWNPGAERVYGYTAQEMVGAAAARLAPPARAGEDVWLAREAAAGRAISEFETKRLRKDGQLIDILLSMAPIQDEDGRVIAVATIERDITRRKRAEAELRASEARLEAIVDNSPLVLFIKDLEGRYLLANRSYYELFHTSAEALLGRTDHQRLPLEIAEQFRAHDRQVIESGRPMEFEESAEIDGVQRTYVSTKFPLRDANGRVYAVCGISTDITEQKRQQEQLREIDRRKDQFLSMLAHELRNPLAPIVNAVQVLRLGGQTEWAADVIERQAAHLTHLVDDLLDIARINSGRIQLRRNVVEMGRLVRHCAETVHPRFEVRRVTLTVHLAAEALVVEGDEGRLAQVIDNLLDNAAKYTDPGGRVELELRHDGAHCLVRVSDTGIGIEPDYLPRVFDLFEQADASLARADGGLGLGLNLVQRLVQMHGGSVAAHSAGVGRGSTFVVRLPLAAREVAADEGQHELPRTPAPRRVLVIDDHVDVAQSLKMLLLALGQDVQVAHSGADGLRMVETFRPDLVLADLGLPDMSGFEVARTLRERYGHELCLVAVSGYGQQEYLARSKAAGFDEHLVKPPSVDALVGALERAGRRGAQTSSQ